MQTHGEMVQQEQQESQTRLARKIVDIIQDQGGIVLEQALKVVEETGQHLFVLVWMPGPITLSRDVQACIDTSQSRDERGKEACRIVLCFLAGKPSYRSRGRGSPFGQERGFTRASWSRDQCHWPELSLLQEREQAGACHMLYGQARGVMLLWRITVGVSR
jgi:hypothetical protein